MKGIPKVVKIKYSMKISAEVLVLLVFSVIIFPGSRRYCVLIAARWLLLTFAVRDHEHNCIVEKFAHFTLTRK